MSKQNSGSTVSAGPVMGTAERTEEGSVAAAGGKVRRRWTAARKLEAVMSVVKGQSLDSVSRKHGIGLSELSGWHKTFLSGAEEILKSKEPTDAFDGERKELLAKIGEITMDCELLREKIRRLENDVPFRLRR